MTILQIAIASPLNRSFDYLPPTTQQNLQPGMRVRVPFGHSTRIGIIIAISADSRIDRQRLKAVIEVLDDEPLLTAELLKLTQWASRYYHHPLGQVVLHALPTLLRQGEAAQRKTEQRWRLNAAGRRINYNELSRAPRQSELLQLLQTQTDGLSSDTLNPSQRNALRALRDRRWLETVAIDDNKADVALELKLNETPPPLYTTQQQAVDTITRQLDSFQVHLVNGITGSGKTEVYFQTITEVLKAGRQVLVLVPEIGLTPQLVSRFEQRFTAPLTTMHSGLSERERLDAWLAAHSGQAKIIVGTRSAVFASCPALGLIILDEEHDASFKQQDGFRYHGRDLAILRARNLNIPVIMGSATPSLESLHNALSGRYHHLQLPHRTGNAVPPQLRLIDVRHQKMDDGLSTELLQAIHQHLQQDNQVLLFLNRRGYAPTLFCHDCGWVARCQRCDAHLIYHQHRRLLRCHHCDAQRPVETACPQCAGSELRPLGHGTERIEAALQQHYPAIEIIRFDRDSTRRKGELHRRLDQIKTGRKQILLGTQMLAKGHHLPNVTLVGIIDADPGLHSTDFRASEQMGQMILQVAGRAGRADKAGEVLIQTHHPDHPLLQILLSQDYAHYARCLLDERQQAALPPFSHFALLRAESTHRDESINFLDAARAAARQHSDLELLGPIPAAMERKAGRYRAQLLIRSQERRSLHDLINRWLPELKQLPAARRVRWNLDVDPLETA